MPRIPHALARPADQAATWLRRPALPRTWPGRAALAGLIAVILGGSAGGYYWSQAGSLPAGVAFAVGGHSVTISQLNQREKTLRALYGIQVPSKPSEVPSFRQAVAKSEAVTMVLQEQAAKRRITVASSVAAKSLDDYVKSQLGSGKQAQAEFAKLVGSAGTSQAAVVSEIQLQLSINQMFGEVTKNVTVSAQQARSQFPKYEYTLGVPQKRHLRNIVVSTQQEAQQIAEAVQEGASFESLAGQYSLDGSTRSKGGDMGTVTEAKLDSGYGKAAFAAKPGQVFGPVQDGYGWNVGQVVSATPARPAVYDTVAKQLQALVLQQKKLAVWSAWVSSAIKNADVRYAPAYQPAHPDAVPAGAQPEVSQ